MDTVQNFESYITLIELSRRLSVNRRTLSRWMIADVAAGHPLDTITVGTAKMVSITNAQIFAARRHRLLSN
jgi:hypothetical protein